MRWRFVREHRNRGEFQEWAAFVADERYSLEATANYTGVDLFEMRAVVRIYATGGDPEFYYGLGVTDRQGFRGVGRDPPASIRWPSKPSAGLSL